MTRYLIVLITILFSLQADANFGGYQRGEISALGQQYIFDENNVIELTKERLTFHLDKRIQFSGKFEFKNTSSKVQTIMLAFPQETFWEVPFNDKSEKYEPGRILKVEPKFAVNGKALDFQTGMTWAIQDVKKITFLNPKEMAPALVEYAGMNEAESPPSKPIALWFYKEIAFQPHQEITAEISFDVSWSYQDEDWSTGLKKGKRYFRYITKTGGSWKDGQIKDFGVTATLSNALVKHLNFEPKSLWKQASPTQFRIQRKDYRPGEDLIITKKR